MRQFNDVTYYIWTIVFTINLYYWVIVDALSMPEDTQINSLLSKPDKYEDINTGQYMEPKD